MKHIFTLTITILLFCFSSAAGSPRVGHYPTGMCTRDFNLWGHASQCSCNEQEQYDARAGLCFKDGDGEKIMVQGAILTGMVTIGGETTGFVIKTPEEVSYELVLKVTDQEKLQKISGMWFEVTGDFINIMSVEMGARKAIIVDTLGVLE